MILQLTDDDGGIIFEAQMGSGEGEWDIHSPDEAGLSCENSASSNSSCRGGPRIFRARSHGG